MPKKKKSNPNAVKWWCDKYDCHMYLNGAHNEAPKKCKECTIISCRVNYDETYIPYMIWMAKSPFGNEYFYKTGKTAVVKFHKFSVEEWANARLIYSMPPNVVHNQRNQWIANRYKYTENSWKYKLLYKFFRIPFCKKWAKGFDDHLHQKAYRKFTRELVELCKQNVKGFKPGIAHWKNPKMARDKKSKEWIAQFQNDSDSYGKE